MIFELFLRLRFVHVAGLFLLGFCPVASIQADTLYSQSTPSGGSATVMPFPESMTMLDWISAGGPGTQVQPFFVSGQNYIMNSITLQMGDAVSTLGGFDVSLRTAGANGLGGTSLSLVQTLAGSSNPATAGSYTYTGQVPLFAGTGYWVVAQVGSGGGTYLWSGSTEGGRILVTPNGPIAAPTLGPLDLSNVLLFNGAPGGLIFSVDVTPVDLAGGLQLANLMSLTLQTGGQAILGDLNNHLFFLLAGAVEEEYDGSIAASLDDGVIVGQGDGPESPIGKRVSRSRQWELFTTVNYGYLNLNAMSGQAGVRVDSWAPGIGIERHLARGLTLGFAASFLSSHQSYGNGLGTLNLDGPALSAYVSYARRNFWGSLLYSFGTYDMDSTRNPGAGIPLAYGSTRAYTNAVQFNTGWNFRFQNNTLVTGPYAGIDWLHGSIDSFSETGGGIVGLNYASQSFDSLVTRVGWSLSKKIRTDRATLTPQVRLGYERQNLNNNGTSVQAINAPFSLSGGNQNPGQDYMVAGGGVNVAFNDRFSLLLNYQGQFFRNNMQAHFGGVRFSYRF
ncbi:autotransporter outer membrane beta-barrel domain-containing protein [Prosthecobacter sp.]|uniref:autotransporter family protein n=1 Tax=Prosthecobacter sp. TaxID=1965333 RepID=UPI001D4D83E6|nr:autotransporter outer membrane beta-barrel domain-containing protein [Prosthecobacter sp.]MCB1275630.1 autotransporter outer membrane beta-barrel domain-containing protein [Prosthecobacter sp.]